MERSFEHARWRGVSGPLVAVAVVVFVGSVFPLPSGGDATVAIAPLGIEADKWVHAASYAALAALAVRNRAAWHVSYGALGLLLVVLAVASFGAGIEVAQSFVPGRTASGGDAVANTVGALAGVVAAVSWQTVFRRADGSFE